MKSIKFIVFGSIVFFLQSCFTPRGYQKPVETIDERYYRTDQLEQGDASLADFSYKDIFTDSLLQSYIARGLENNLDVRMALENIEIAEAYARQAKLAYFPSLSISPGISYQTQSLNTQFGQLIGERRYLTQYDLTAGASWQLDIFGELRSSQRAAQAYLLQTSAAHQAVKSALVAGIANTYFQLLSLDEQLRFTEETIALLEETVETNQALKEAGIVTEVAVKQSQAQLTNIKASRIDIQNAIFIAENQMAIFLGEPGFGIARSSIAEQETPEEILTGVPSTLLRNRPDVLQAEAAYLQAFHDVNVARANFYPSFVISANAGLQSIDIERLFDVNSLFASVVGSLTQPIFQRGQLKANLAVAESQQEIALLSFHQTILEAGREVSDAMRIYRTQDELIELKNQEYNDYNTATDFSQELLNNGMANYLEVITAQRNALNAQLAAINAQYAKLNALVDIYYALGGGWK